MKTASTITRKNTKASRFLKVTPVIFAHVREGAQECGMSEERFATMALREYFKAMEKVNGSSFIAVNLLPDIESSPNANRDEGGPLRSRIAIDPEIDRCITRLEKEFQMVNWWHEAKRGLILCSDAAVWQSGPKWAFTVEPRKEREEEGIMRSMIEGLC